MTERLEERRGTPFSEPIELRRKSNTPTRIGGYAAKYERRSQNLGGFVEVIRPGFFDVSRSDGWDGVMARYNHDDNMLLGTTQGGSLTLILDRTGLLYEVEPTPARRDVVELIERGDVARSSFAFRAFEDDWDLGDDGLPRRHLLSGQLVDVAPVNTPAYKDTSTGLRSLAERVDAPLEEVRALAAANELRRVLMNSPGGDAATRAAFAASKEAAIRRGKARLRALELQRLSWTV